MGCIGETIVTRRQQAGQLSRPEAVNLSFAWGFDPKQYSRECPVRGGEEHQPAGLGLKARSSNKHTSLFVDVLAYRIEVSSMDKPDRYRLRFAGARKDWMHDYSAASRIEGFGM